MSSNPPRAPVARPGLEPLSRPGPAGGKRDENRKKRTQEICDAALRLFLSLGLEQVTIDDIVRKADVAKGSFYRYFVDKVDLVAVLFAPVSERVLQAFQLCEDVLRASRTPEELSAAYQGLALELAAIVMEHPDVVRLYLQECRAPDVGARKPVVVLAAEINQRAVSLTHVAHDQGLLRAFNSRVSAMAVVGAVEHLLFRFLSGDALGEVYEIPPMLVSLILDGLRVPPPVVPESSAGSRDAEHAGQRPEGSKRRR